MENHEQAPNPMLVEPEICAPVAPAAGNAPLPEVPPPGRRAAATFIFMTVALDMLALGVIAPVFPQLIEGFYHGSVADATKQIGLFATVFALIQFLFSPLLGALSDKVGRRPVVLASNFGMGLDYFVMALAPTLGWLWVGRVISGLTSSSIPTAFAYMADTTPPEKRAATFGMLSGAFGIGFIVGPALGGILGQHDPRLPFYVAGALSLINGLYGLFVLPESLAEENRAKTIDLKRANPVGSLVLFTRVKGLLPLAMQITLGYVAQTSLMQVYVLYTQHRYVWTAKESGWSLSLVGLVTALYGVFLVKKSVEWMGERGAIIVGYLGGAIGYAIFGASTAGWMLLAGIPLLNLATIAWPSAQAIMSRNTPPSEQGLLQGAVQSLRGIAGILGPGLFTGVFGWSLGREASQPWTLGSTYYIAAALLLAGLGVVFFGGSLKLAEAKQRG